MTKKIIYEMSKLINCEYELGIWSEINSFMEYNEETVSDYILGYLQDEQSFYLNIKLRNFRKDVASDIFKSFVQFIEYNNATFYLREEKQSNIKFYLLSSMNEGRGLFIQANFS